MRNNTDRKALGLADVDGQTDTVYRNRAFVDHVSRKGLWNGNGHHQGISQFLLLFNDANAINVT